MARQLAKKVIIKKKIDNKDINKKGLMVKYEDIKRLVQQDMCVDEMRA